MADPNLERGGEARRPSYTVAAATRLLPILTKVLRSLQLELSGATDESATRRVEETASHNGGSAAASAMLQAGERVRQQMTFLSEHGILLRDLGSGLVDFPAEREGRAVFLCWRLGEATIGYWHRRDQGFVNREPL
ncbi:MAG: DUF2203 domain-containing protein [Candidatus Dormibacteria bacterium]